MQTVTLAEAQARLPELIAGMRGGEDLLVVEDERPVAKIVATAADEVPRVRKAGSLRGMIVERADCWENETEMWKEYMP